METSYAKKMIERFFDAELSVDEERELCRYLCENDVPAELQKDKETILALCIEDTFADVPDGFEERLEAMIDALNDDVEQQPIVGPKIKEQRKKASIMSPILWRSAVAVALLTIGCLLMNNEEQCSEKDTLADVETEIPEKDTFDNPQDAMQCFKAAFNDLKFAFNAAQQNMTGIGAMLEESAYMSRNGYKKNI